MRVEDLELKELIELSDDGGLIRFAGERSLLFDAYAFGELRKSIVQTVGARAARSILWRFGFAHGYRLAEAFRTQFRWESDTDWHRAVVRVGSLLGFAQPREDTTFAVDSGMQGSFRGSFEADQHLEHLGRSEWPACWVLCGTASGVLSRISGNTLIALETKCVAKGDSECYLIARTEEQWAAEKNPDAGCLSGKCISDLLDDSLKETIEALKHAEQKLRAHRRALVRVAPEVEDPLGMVSKSDAMRQIVDLAKRVARVDTTVLITGESGAGKERVARLVHEHSPRASGPFIAINCGAIAETLLESELFGHAKGAFTGAANDRPGLFEAANGGTLLLDEVGEVSPGMQVKLLRALQEREIRRVGENASRSIDVRVVAATNRDLTQEVRKGTFRQDLFYRLKVVELRVPSLRERTEDILPLARVLLAEASERMKRKINGLAPKAADQLLRYEWPGNVRELENAIERAVALSSGERVELEDLPEDVREAAMRPVFGGSIRPLDEIEKEYILAALRLNGGNQTKTAGQLGIGAATLWRRLKSYKADGISIEPRQAIERA